MFKFLCLLFIFTSFFTDVFSQDLPLLKNNPIAIAAPHLPLMMKYDGQGLVYNIEKTKYKFDVIERDLKSWMRNYPDELIKYKYAICAYLNNTSPNFLASEPPQLYRDLKSQWLLINQF